MRVAVAALDGMIVGGHFAHAPRFLVYKVEKGSWSLLEERKNPLGDVPDLDYPGAEADLEAIVHAHGMHGPQKYMFLRREVLPDVDVVVAGGACPTSVTVFVNDGVKIILAEPGTPVEEVLKVLSSNPEDIPDIGFYEEGAIEAVA
ncbi:MAG: NifB/NifX family molybdenum-iron cluster-binding protein [Desulfurococcales archaeon]|nr:NifB/NifX family molybdenum-iron cluster-binding protein [Desulfurococcales archaeon]